jgi:mannose-1-phosphate guanylyltransferase
MVDLRTNSVSDPASGRSPVREPLGVRSIVLLAGTVGPESLPARVGRSVLDLPIDRSLRLLDVWLLRIGELSHEFGPGVPGAAVRVLCGESDPMPRTAALNGLPVSAERDRGRFRGTAGVLRDLCDRFGEADHVLVGTASQCPDAGVLERFIASADPSDGVTLGVTSDGAPNGLMLVRCGALAPIPAVGYIDLKEQALPRIAEAYGVRVVVSPGVGTTPIRGVEDYIDVVRSWHRLGTLRSLRAARPFDERWRPAFSIVETGADVAPGSRIHDSVVLAGGVVGDGCELIRSVVGPGGVARRGRRVVDQVLTGVAPAGAPRRVAPPSGS